MNMNIIVTLPPPHLSRMHEVALNVDADMFRFNTGVKTPYSPKETLEDILKYVPKEKLWIDIKGRQLRIEQWAVYPWGNITINRDIKVDLPATIFFRNEERSSLIEIQGRNLFVDPGPIHYVGAGQAINIIGNTFEVLGDYLTDIDKQYIESAKELGVHRYMLSYLEKEIDVEEVLSIDPDAIISGKIESAMGISFYLRHSDYIKKRNIILVAARDDLFINLDKDKYHIFYELNSIVKHNPDAIVASKILTSLERSNEVSFTDLSDVYLLQEMNYKTFMLSDGLSTNPEILRKAVSILRNF